MDTIPQEALFDKGEILRDLKTNGKPRPWKPKKARGLKVADSFDRLGQEKRAKRIRDCGNFLEFTVDVETGKKRLSYAHFCRERLCPMCQWRKSLKVFWEVSRVMDICQAENPKLVPVFLTLTLRNCRDEELSDVLSNVFDGWHNFLNDRTIKSRVKGWFRALELTYNRGTGMHHPHLHAIIFVEKDYFKSREYLCQKCWTWLWQKALRVDYKPIVDIRRVKNEKGKRKSVSEVAKYTLKDSEFITDDEVLTDKLVSVYTGALKGRRLYAFGGILKDIAKRLGSENPEDGDLVHIGGDTIRQDIATITKTYFWHVGIASYVTKK